MNHVLKVLSDHNFLVHSLAFALMVIPPFFMYLAAIQGALGWIWGLIFLVVLGNILALITK